MKIIRIVHAALGLATVAATLALIVVSSDPKADGFSIVGLVVLCCVPLVGVVIALAIEGFLAPKGARRRILLPRLVILLVHAGVVAAVIAVCALEWPLRVRFQLSRAALEALAQEVLTTHRGLNQPRRVGLYIIRSADLDQAGGVELHLGDCSWYYACDFVFHPKADCVRAVTRAGSVIDSHWCMERNEGF